MRWLWTAVALLSVGAWATPTPARAAAPEVVSDVVIDGTDGRLHELAVRSEALGRDGGARVLLPAGYDDPAHSQRRYPVLLLLHGAGDDHRTWTQNTDVEGLTAGLPLIVVMPEGGRSPDSGWYSDWVDGPAWETFHLEELLPLVESRYRALGTREGRVIAGLSMGGFGAMSYAARHPDRFVAAASFSGALDTTGGSLGTAAVFELLQPQFGTPGDGVWGPYETSEAVWRGHNPTDLASNLAPLSLSMRTGNGVPATGDDLANPGGAALEAGVYVMNLRFAQTLSGHGIPYTFGDRGHGVHSWTYWEDDLALTLPRLTAVLDDPPPPPESFHHRFVETAREVFGWSFAVDRGVVEFVDLLDVSTGGLTATGTGTLAVTTPAAYPPGTWTVRGDDGSEQVVASDGGRLSFTVDLGPANADDQFTLAARAAEALALAEGRPYRRTVTVTIEAATAAAAPPASVVAEPAATLPATGGGAVPATAAAVALAAAVRRAAAARGRDRGRPRAA